MHVWARAEGVRRGTTAGSKEETARTELLAPLSDPAPVAPGRVPVNRCNTLRLFAPAVTRNEANLAGRHWHAGFLRRSEGALPRTDNERKE